LPPQGPIGGETIVTISDTNFSGATVTLDRTPLAALLPDRMR
jgi:hypothetical protein